MTLDPSSPDSPVHLTPAADPHAPAFVPDEFDAVKESASTPYPRRRAVRMTPSRLRMWLMVGGVLWAVGLAGWLILAVQGCEGEKETGPPAKKRK